MRLNMISTLTFEKRIGCFISVNDEWDEPGVTLRLTRLTGILARRGN